MKGDRKTKADPYGMTKKQDRPIRRGLWIWGGFGSRLGGQPLVKGDVEVEEGLLVAVFVGDGVDHLDVEFGSLEGWVV